MWDLLNSVLSWSCLGMWSKTLKVERKDLKIFGGYFIV